MPWIRVTPAQKRNLKRAQRKLSRVSGRDLTQGGTVEMIADQVIRLAALMPELHKPRLQHGASDPLLDRRTVFRMGPAESGLLDDLISGDRAPPREPRGARRPSSAGERE